MILKVIYLNVGEIPTAGSPNHRKCFMFDIEVLAGLNTLFSGLLTKYFHISFKKKFIHPKIGKNSD